MLALCLGNTNREDLLSAGKAKYSALLILGCATYRIYVTMAFSYFQVSFAIPGKDPFCLVLLQSYHTWRRGDCPKQNQLSARPAE